MFCRVIFATKKNKKTKKNHPTDRPYLAGPSVRKTREFFFFFSSSFFVALLLICYLTHQSYFRYRKYSFFLQSTLFKGYWSEILKIGKRVGVDIFFFTKKGAGA